MLKITSITAVTNFIFVLHCEHAIIVFTIGNLIFCKQIEFCNDNNQILEELTFILNPYISLGEFCDF